jgi:hypothetical protein
MRESFPVPTERSGQFLVPTGDAEDRVLQERIGHCRKQQDDSVKRHGCRREGVFAHPAGDERDQRQPEQEMQVGPQNAAIHLTDNLKQVVMVVPVNSQIDKTEQVAEEDGKQRLEAVECRRVEGDFQLEHHDGDQDGHDAVAKRLQPAAPHEFPFGNSRHSTRDGRHANSSS